MMASRATMARSEGGDDGKEEDKPVTSAQLDAGESNGVAFANGLNGFGARENPASVIEADATEKAIHRRQNRCAAAV